MTKKRQSSAVKWHNCGFLSHIFRKLRYLERYTHLNACVFEFLAQKKAFHILTRALGAVTARNKWLKKALRSLMNVVFNYTWRL